jgi:hypothetical protein
MMWLSWGSNVGWWTKSTRVAPILQMKAEAPASPAGAVAAFAGSAGDGGHGRPNRTVQAIRSHGPIG